LGVISAEYEKDLLLRVSVSEGLIFSIDKVIRSKKGGIED
jgi:hypothetical protein